MEVDCTHDFLLLLYCKHVGISTRCRSICGPQDCSIVQSEGVQKYLTDKYSQPGPAGLSAS